MPLPIRTRLSLLFAVAMAFLLLVIGGYVYVRTSSDLLASVDAGLRSRAQTLTDALGTSQEHDLISGTGVLVDPDESFAQVLGSDGGILDTSAIVRRAPLLSPAEVAAVVDPMAMTRDVARLEDPVRLFGVPAERAGQPVVVVVGTNLGDTNDALHRLLLVMVTAGPAGLLLTSAAGWLLAGAALRPVEAMRREASAISSSEPQRRLAVPATGDEIARLAATLNQMLDRLEDGVERERRFVDDASHELRTPLAAMRAEIELTLGRTRTAADYLAALQAIESDVARLARLADDLLVLARARGGRVPVRRSPQRLTELVGGCVASVAETARARRVTLTVAVPDVVVSVDPDRVRQALGNLLANALRHTEAGGVVSISASYGAGTLELVVSDTGPGFPADLLDRAFDPFTRGSGPTDDQEGTGLGLAIVRAVASAHDGTVRAENLGGARVTMTLRA